MANEPEEGHFPEEEEGGPVKSFLEHLEDFRWALIKSCAAIAIGVLICLLAGNYVVAILMRPLDKASISYPGTNQVVTVTLGTNRFGPFNLDAAHEELFNLDPNRHSPTFSAQDIFKLKPFVGRLINPSKEDGVSQYLSAQLSDKTRNLLSTYLGSTDYRRGGLRNFLRNFFSPNNGGANLELQQALADDLNRIIQGGSNIYNAQIFAGAKLSDATTTLLAKNPQGQDLVRLNQKLLLDAYPKEISKNRDRFVALEIVPADFNTGTNQVRGFGFQVNTNVDAAMQAQHLNTGIIVLGPAKAFLVGFRVALYAGVAMASPFVFFFMGQFILPALKIREKRYLYRGLAFAIPLFFSGVCFCYFILLPAALAASQIYAEWFGFSSNMWEAGDYIGFVCKFMLGMGLGFEMPVVILVLVKIGLLNYRILSKARPYMIVINLVLGAVLTTPEVFTQVLMAIPLQLLYEISVWIAWYWERQEKKRAAAAGDEND